MKHKLFILLGLLWISAQSFSASVVYENRALYIRIPSQLNFSKYRYELKTNYSSEVSVCSFQFLRTPGEVVRCDLRSDYYGNFKDTMVNLRFSVKMTKYYGEYVVNSQVVVKSDSVFYTIPELPDEATIDSILKAQHKAFNKAHRGEDFVELMTDWKSYFLYVNFYQGNRLFGEVSFSNARYDEIQTGSPFSRYRSSEPGFIRGPVYGAEFNFLWRKDDFILGPKIGFQLASRFVNLGISGVYYTDFTHGLFCIKPRIGINPKIPWVNFSYEYAIRCGYNYFGNRINRHQFSVYFVIPLRLED